MYVHVRTCTYTLYVWCVLFEGTVFRPKQQNVILKVTYTYVCIVCRCTVAFAPLSGYKCITELKKVLKCGGLVAWPQTTCVLAVPEWS